MRGDCLKWKNHTGLATNPDFELGLVVSPFFIYKNYVVSRYNFRKNRAGAENLHREFAALVWFR